RFMVVAPRGAARFLAKGMERRKPHRCCAERQRGAAAIQRMDEAPAQGVAAFALARRWPTSPARPSTYEAGPNPATRARHAGAMRERRRKTSRASGLERWTST